MKSLSPAEICKYTWRRELILKKIKEQSPFELMNGANVLIHHFTRRFRILDATQDEFRQFRLYDHEGNEYKLSDLAKTSEFGGKGNGLKRENDALNALNRHLHNTDRCEFSTGLVPVYVCGQVHHISHAESTPGTPKADFHLINGNGEECIWISHKHGSKPIHFQQWGGVSGLSDTFMAYNEHINRFARDIEKLYPRGLVAGTTLFREFQDTRLKVVSVYGKNYGQEYGRDNVQLVLQGDVKLVWNFSKKAFVIQGSAHTYENGDEILGEYEPTLYAVYKTDRSDKGVKNCRITINPLGSRNKRTRI